MKTSRALLSCMVVMLMMPAFADDSDSQQRGLGKRDGGARQQTVTTKTATQSQPSFEIRRSPNSFMGFKSIPIVVPKANTPNTTQVNVPRPQPQIQNQPVGHRDDRDGREQNRRDYANTDDANRYRNRAVYNGVGNDGYLRHSDPNLTSRGYIRANNSNLTSDGYIRTYQNRNINLDYSRGRDIRDRDHQGWRNQNRIITQYRMPYRQGYSDRYRVNYTRGWPTNYSWYSHGWSVNYREADPYWFALITSIALAQAWSDAEVAQAINDDNLRQQLIYDEDIRQQMIASGYPADQVYYSDDYDNPYDLNRTYPPQNPPVYYPPNVSTNPNSPLYNGGSSAAQLASGTEVANRNANQNVLFFCTAGNKPQTAEALRFVQSPDLSIWKTLESYHKCRTWAVSP